MNEFETAMLEKMVQEYQDVIVPGLRAELEKRVDVVRCKDCKHTMLLNLFSISDNRVEEKVPHCGLRLGRVQPDDFCSWGERREVMP